MRWPRFSYPAALMAIVLLAVGLRFYHLGDWSMWIDEGMTWQRAISGRLDDQGPLYATAPLNFLVTRWIIQANGDSLFWLRFFPAVAGCLGVAAVIAAAHRIGGRVCAVFAGALVALSVWHIDWSQNARHYSMVFLAATVAFGAYYEFWERGRWPWIVVSVLASAVGLASHSSMAFVIVALAAYTGLLLVDRRARQAVVTPRKILIAGGAYAALMLAYLPIVFSVSKYLGENKSAWNPPFNVASGIVFYLGVTPLALAGLIAIHGLWKGSRPYMLAGCWLLVPAVLAPIAAASTISSNVYAFSSLGGMAILIGLGLAELSEQPQPAVRLLAGALAVALLAGAASRDLLYYFYEGGNRPPWKEVAEWLEPRLEEGDLVFSSEGPVLGFHLGAKEYGEFITAWARKGVRSGRREWVAVLEGREAMPHAIKRRTLGETCLLRKVFYRNSGAKRRDVEVWECPPRPVTSSRGSEPLHDVAAPTLGEH